jgi:hypothetical protein
MFYIRIVLRTVRTLHRTLRIFVSCSLVVSFIHVIYSALFIEQADALTIGCVPDSLPHTGLDSYRLGKDSDALPIFIGSCLLLLIVGDVEESLIYQWFQLRPFLIPSRPYEVNLRTLGMPTISLRHPLIEKHYRPFSRGGHLRQAYDYDHHERFV